MPKKLTTQEVIYRIEQKFPNKFDFSLLEYHGKRIKIKLKCRDCGSIQEEYILSLLNRETSCFICLGKEKHTPKKMSHKEFLDLVYSFHPNIKILSTFKNLKTNIKCKCLYCNNTWTTIANNLKRGSNCPECVKDTSVEKRKGKYNKKHIQTLNIIKRIKNILYENNMKLLDSYKDQYKKLKVFCFNCNNISFVSPFTIKNNKTICKSCSKKSSTITNEEFLNRLYKITNIVKPLENYVGCNKKIKCECVVCGGIFYPYPSNLWRNQGGCPHCKQSKGERAIEYFLKKNNFVFDKQKKFDNLVLERNLYFDFYLPDYELCIEYDGKQHFEPIDFFGGYDYFVLCKKRDEIKNKFCEENNINLLRIPYWEKENIEKIITKKLKDKKII